MLRELLVASELPDSVFSWESDQEVVRGYDCPESIQSRTAEYGVVRRRYPDHSIG